MPSNEFSILMMMSHMCVTPPPLTCVVIVKTNSTGNMDLFNLNYASSRLMLGKLNYKPNESEQFHLS